MNSEADPIVGNWYRHLDKGQPFVVVAVDDEAKRDYFLPRLQAILDGHTWARHLTFRVVPVMGGEPVDLRATTPEEGVDRNGGAG